MELQRALRVVGGGAFHHELTPTNDLLAGVAGLAVAGTAPDPRDAVVRQTTIRELLSNEDAQANRFHDGKDGLPLKPLGSGPWP
jgi:hypothetical protein